MQYDQQVIDQAIEMLSSTVNEPTEFINNSKRAKDLCTLNLCAEKNEVFGVVFLNNQHGIIAFEKLFFGTINSSAVHPRVVIQRSLAHNAAAVILTHNHPSGVLKPSLADLDITSRLKTALAYVDVRVIDHIIVAGVNTHSFEDHGEL